MHPLCSLCFGSEITNSVCNSTSYVLLRSPMHGGVTAGQRVRCLHTLQYTNFGFYLSLLQICAYMGCQTSESKAGNAITFSLQWYYFKNHVQANYCMLYIFSHIRNQRAPDKRTAVPRSHIQILFWTKLSNVWGSVDCEVLREASLRTHTVHSGSSHWCRILQKSVKYLTNIILWEMDFLLNVVSYTLPQNT